MTPHKYLPSKMMHKKLQGKTPKYPKSHRTVKIQTALGVPKNGTHDGVKIQKLAEVSGFNKLRKCQQWF